MTAVSHPVPRSLQGPRDDRTDQAAPAQEPAAADTASCIATEAAQQDVAWVYTGGSRRSLHAAALRSLRHLRLPGAGGMPVLSVIRPRIRRCAATRHAAR